MTQSIKELIKNDSKGFDSLKQYLEEVIKHGCVSGIVSSLIYYEDTNKFYEGYKEEIWDLLYAEAEEQGVNILELISSFCGADAVGSEVQFKNLLAWYYYEQTAYKLLLEEVK